MKLFFGLWLIMISSPAFAVPLRIDSSNLKDFSYSCNDDESSITLTLKNGQKLNGSDGSGGDCGQGSVEAQWDAYFSNILNGTIVVMKSGSCARQFALYDAANKLIAFDMEAVHCP